MADPTFLAAFHSITGVTIALHDEGEFLIYLQLFGVKDYSDIHNPEHSIHLLFFTSIHSKSVRLILVYDVWHAVWRACWRRGWHKFWQTELMPYVRGSCVCSHYPFYVKPLIEIITVVVICHELVRLAVAGNVNKMPHFGSALAGASHRHRCIHVRH